MNRTNAAAWVMTLGALGAAPAAASVTFQNTGTKTGWSNYPQQPQQQGTITEVSSPVYQGPTALRFRQIFVDNNRERYHSEVMQSNAQGNNTDRYYGVALYIPGNWVWHSQNHTWQQWATNTPSSPWLGMMVGGAGGHQLQYHFVRGALSGSETDFADVSALRATWIRVVARLNMRTSGNWEVWVNGTRRVSRTGDVSTSWNGSPTIRWSTGIYCGPWYRSLPTGPSDLSLYGDHYRIATTYDEAEPGNWGGTGPTPTPTPVPTATPGPGPTATPTATPTPTPSGGGFSGYYRITPRHSGKAVAVQSASTANSANVFQWSYGGTNTNDEWQLLSIGSGYYRVIARHSGKDMVVASASTAEGANIFQYAYGGTTTNDEWAVVDVGGGYHRVTNRHSGKSAEVVGAGTADGTDVAQRTYSGATHQQFQMISVP
jgi:hypothetical protein